MFQSIKSLIGRRRLHRAAISAALAAFHENSEERPIKNMVSVVASDGTRLIVQVCFGDTRPPGRAWFAVVREDRLATQLTVEEVNEVYDVPVWR